ncbi:MAG: RNA polymerase sigma factor [Kineosporiaceae bacterium]
MDRVQGGCNEAFAELYRRHEKAARRYARKLCTGVDDASDVVSDVFMKLFQLLREGRGPSGDFAPYLTRMLRNASYDRARSSRRLVATDRIEDLDSVSEFDDPVTAEHEQQAALRALESLPARWQRVLWLTCVEEQPLPVVASVLGMQPNAVTSLAYRARAGLRRAYVQVHVPQLDHPACREAGSELGGYVCGGAGMARKALVEWHIAACADCRRIVSHLREVADELPRASVGVAALMGRTAA